MNPRLSCAQATRLLSESQERALGTSERTLLRVHTWICSGCRNFGDQLGFIRQAMKGFAAHESAPGDGADAGDAAGKDSANGPPPDAV